MTLLPNLVGRLECYSLISEVTVFFTSYEETCYDFLANMSNLLFIGPTR